MTNEAAFIRTVLGKRKVSELIGAELDLCVAMGLNLPRPSIMETDWRRHRARKESDTCYALVPINEWTTNLMFLPFEPSTSWRQGGPILESERILLGLSVTGRAPGTIVEWEAESVASYPDRGPTMVGHTPLIAAMRAFVASKLGEEVELP